MRVLQWDALEERGGRGGEGREGEEGRSGTVLTATVSQSADPDPTSLRGARGGASLHEHDSSASIGGLSGLSERGEGSFTWLSWLRMRHMVRVE